jgi:hypothetical protein
MIRGVRRAALLASLVVVVACCCWTLPSAAQVAALDWSAPRGCPDSTYVAQRLAATQGETERRELRVRARIQRVGRSAYLLRLTLRADDLHAERRLQATSCKSVTDAAIWLVAVALSPDLQAHAGTVATMDAAPPPATPRDESGSRVSENGDASASRAPSAERPSTLSPTAQGTGTTEPVAAAPAAATPAPTPRAAPPLSYPARRAPWRLDWAALPRWWRAGVFSGVWSAGLPAPQLSLGARLGLGISALYAELRGAAELARGRRLADATEARFATQHVGLAVCAQWGGDVRVGPCATAAVLRTAAGSRNVPDANDRVLPWSAAGVALALGWRAPGGVEVMLETGVQLPLSARPRFTVEGVGEVAVAAPVNVYARVGLGFRSADLRRGQ